MALKINEKTIADIEKFVATNAKKKRGRPRKINYEAKNNSAVNEKIINSGQHAYFTNVIEGVADVFTVEFTNVKEDPRIFIEWFNAEFRKLCNRLQKERPFIPYAGYRLIEHTEKDAQIFGQIDKTRIIITAIGQRFISKVVELFETPKNTNYVEIFFDKSAKKRDMYAVKQRLIDAGLADTKLLKTFEDMPNYCRTSTNNLHYLLYIIMRIVEDKLLTAQTVVKKDIAGRLYSVKIEIRPGNRAESIGVDYGVSGFRYRRAQTFGYWSSNKRYKKNDDCEIDRFPKDAERIEDIFCVQMPQ